ncbi:alpha-amylase family protein [Lacrimispora sp.]|uniref:alpha-amylase family protein n=1 Tax=Lacrimispora sp. TaxID=2719234 RepID=UPI00289AE582|nr:family 10 glycosylhydrolase [Lacrimispora sp.]
MREPLWWKEPMRVIQFNLQVKDTNRMNPVKIARETEEMAGNVVVMNVGGIYAWYDSKVKYHHINEYLPKDKDLLKALIEEFHKKDIKFVARFDFSITDDTTYLEKPQWFARHKDKSPYYRGEKRMGNWSLFLNTCATGGYRNEEVAVPVMNEVIDNYDIDGIFFNAPFASACFCERCQEKYFKKYGKPMPDNAEEFEDGWLSQCTKDNIAVIYKAIKAKREDIPMILYYNPSSAKSKSFGRFDRDSIYDRYETADLICTESQNVLSNGINEIPEIIHPIFAMKSGQTEDGSLLPFGIIHSCPGMDWRHVGLPEAEYLSWMCQVPASRGVIWHSLTGYNDTITDKRIIRAVTEADQMIKKSENDMKGAVSKAEVLLLCNGTQATRGWSEALVKSHIQFDLMHKYRMNGDKMKQYPVVIAPEGFLSYEGIPALLEEYVKDGGNLIAENTDYESSVNNSLLLGVKKEINVGEFLNASYLRFEEEGLALKKGMDTDKVAFRGVVSYCTPAGSAKTLATLVPPFSPLDVAGAPPERSSIPTPNTDIPLCILNSFGKGKVFFLPFSLNALITGYKMPDHYQLISNAIDSLLGDRREIEVNVPSAVQVSMYEKAGQILVHFVNEIGQRPLMEHVPFHDLSFSVKLKDSQTVKNVRSVIGEENLSFQVSEGRVEVWADKLKVWDMFSIDIE